LNQEIEMLTVNLQDPSPEELGLIDMASPSREQRLRLSQIQLLHRQILMYEHEHRARQEELGMWLYILHVLSL
jgi:hypothetical protein